MTLYLQPFARWQLCWCCRYAAAAMRLGGRHNMPPPRDLDFDLLTLKSVWESHVTWGTPMQSFVFLGLLVFELQPMYATSDGQTDDGRRSPLNAPPRGGGITMGPKSWVSGDKSLPVECVGLMEGLVDKVFEKQKPQSCMITTDVVGQLKARGWEAGPLVLHPCLRRSTSYCSR